MGGGVIEDKEMKKLCGKDVEEKVNKQTFKGERRSYKER